MRYCKKCLFPDTKPDLFFDKNGICDACRSAERKHGLINAIDWDQRKIDFTRFINQYRSKNGLKYDCLVPVSGGKDSVFQTYAMKVIHKMNPLAVTFDQFDATSISRYNLEILKHIGVDHLHFTLNPNIVRLLVKKGFEIVGDPYWINHVGTFTIPTRIAVNFNIPLIIWGEQSEFEYGGPPKSKENTLLDKRWRQEFGGMRGFREEDMVDEKISLADLKILFYPKDEEVERVGVRGIFYGMYFKWNAREHIKIAEKLGWQHLPKPWPGSWLDYENCDMKFTDIREHLKWVKFGYGRATDQVNIDIRNGVLSRQEGLKIIKRIDGSYSQKSKKEFCQYIGISEKKFIKIRDSYVNKNIFKKQKNGEWQLKITPH